jgi:hypothetical protein
LSYFELSGLAPNFERKIKIKLKDAFNELVLPIDFFVCESTLLNKEPASIQFAYQLDNGGTKKQSLQPIFDLVELQSEFCPLVEPFGKYTLLTEN